MEYDHYCNVNNARQLATWMKERGGLAVWRSAMFGDDTQWTTPVLTAEGQPMDRPHRYAESTPYKVITDPARIGVVALVEFRRFHVALRVSGNGLSLKLTDGANNKLNRALTKAGVGSTYLFDYATQEAVVLKPDPTKTVSMAEWIRRNW